MELHLRNSRCHVTRSAVRRVASSPRGSSSLAVHGRVFHERESPNESDNIELARSMSFFAVASKFQVQTSPTDRVTDPARLRLYCHVSEEDE